MAGVRDQQELQDPSCDLLQLHSSFNPTDHRSCSLHFHELAPPEVAQVHPTPLDSEVLLLKGDSQMFLSSWQVLQDTFPHWEGWAEALAAPFTSQGHVPLLPEGSWLVREIQERPATPGTYLSLAR